MSIDFGALMDQMGTQLEDVPPGEYDVVVKTCEAKQSSNGKPMLKAKFAIENGPFAGRPVYWNATISQDNPNALRIFFGHMKALGLDMDFFRQQRSLDPAAEALINRRARVTIAHRTWNDQVQLDVRAVKPPLNGQATAPAPAAGGGAVPGGASIPAAAPAAPAPQAAAPAAPPAPAAAPAPQAPPAPAAAPAPVAETPQPPQHEAPTPPPPAPAPEQQAAPTPPPAPAAPAPEAAPAPAAPAPQQEAQPAAPAAPAQPAPQPEGQQAPPPPPGPAPVNF